MKVLYFELWTGLSGDMWVGSLLDAGWPADRLDWLVRALGFDDVEVLVERRLHQGLSGLGIRVRDRTSSNAGEVDPSQRNAHGHGHDHSHPHSHEHHDHHAPPSDDPVRHEGSGAHAARGLSEILARVRRAGLPAAVEARIVATFQLLGAVEARIHDIPIEQVHFHEIGAVDSIVDISAAVLALHDLEIERVFCGPLAIGGGEIQMDHGRIPSPAPATSLLLEGWPVRPADAEGEFLTPTAAALLRTLASPVGGRPALAVERIGFGAGTRRHPTWPNLVRCWIGELLGEAAGSAGQPVDEETAPWRCSTVAVLETQVDDLDPRVLASAADRFLAAGALDVLRTSVAMKKGRGGVLVTLIARPEDEARLVGLLAAETKSLGVRVRLDRRWERVRRLAEVDTPWGRLRVKEIREDGGVRVVPEFDDVRAIADRTGEPIGNVLAEVSRWLELGH